MAATSPTPTSKLSEADVRAMLVNIASNVVVLLAIVIWQNVAVTVVALGALLATSVFLLRRSYTRAKDYRTRIAALSQELQAASERLAEAQKLTDWGEVGACTGLDGFRPALEQSEMHPHEALSNINQSLDFMGNGGSKWSRQRDEMAHMLARLQDFGEAGQARMLVLDPFGNVLKRKFDEQRKILGSLMEFNALRAEYPNLKVRLYDHRPKFRITLIDGRRAVIGHYRNYQANSKHTPLLIFSIGPEWSFFSPFKLLFEHEWNRGAEVDWPAVEAAFRGGTHDDAR